MFALKLAYDNTPTIGKERHINNQRIIKEYHNSNNPLDILAVGISYEREGTLYRQKAISCLETFLRNPVPIPFDNISYPPRPLFSYWFIYSTLATLHEKEHSLEKALYYLRLLPKESNYNNPADYTRFGDVLIKIDVNKAVSYYENIKKQPIYNKFKRSIDIAYSKAKELQAKGYQYKPRKRKR